MNLISRFISVLDFHPDPVNAIFIIILPLIARLIFPNNLKPFVATGRRVSDLQQLPAAVVSLANTDLAGTIESIDRIVLESGHAFGDLHGCRPDRTPPELLLYRSNESNPLTDQPAPLAH